jgi:membrane protease YdiL (CAAX protease family)
VNSIFGIWNRWFGDPLRQVEADSLAFRASETGQRLDLKTIIVILIVATCLTIQNFALAPERCTPLGGFLGQLLGGDEGRREVLSTLDSWADSTAPRLMWAGTCMILTYTVLPIFAIKVLFRERLLDYGLGIRGVVRDWPVYLAFAGIMVPLVYIFSFEERFQNIYPFYRVRSRENVDGIFFRWEVVYAIQFMALEFFFRGFMVHGTKHRFGAYAVFVMVIPYCMIHYHKPWPEACGSILAGVGLGVVSLVTRSVWPGAALHIFVAWSMDFSSLYRRGLIG